MPQPLREPERRSPSPDRETLGTPYRIVRLLYGGFAIPARSFEDGRARQATSVARVPTAETWVPITESFGYIIGVRFP